MGDFLTQDLASVFIQTQLGRKPFYVGECVDIDSIPSPRNGGIEFIWCKDGRGGFRRKGKKKTAPGNIEFSLVQMAEADASNLEGLLCEFNVYALWSECGAAGVQRNWDRAAAVIGSEITNDTLSNVAHHIDQNELSRELALVAAPPRLDFYRLTPGRSTVVETYAGNAVINASTMYCGAKCGAYRMPSDVLYEVCDGDVAASGNVNKSTDGGVTWAALAAAPFGVNINLLSIAVFDIDKYTERLLVARAGVAATPMAVAYSDDDGTTWTSVTVGATNLEGATGPRSLWAIDSEHIWLCTDSGNVYFSSDAGESWSLQDASGVGGNPLNCVHFIDEKLGIAVGDTDTVILSDNGGTTWYAGSATGTGNDLTTAWRFDQYRMQCGCVTDPTGSLFQAFDGGVTWESLSYTGYLTEDVIDMYYYNGARGYMISETGGVSSVHFTIDGGATWEEQPNIPTNAGINAVLMTSDNKVVLVGEPQGGTSYVARIANTL